MKRLLQDEDACGEVLGALDAVTRVVRPLRPWVGA